MKYKNPSKASILGPLKKYPTFKFFTKEKFQSLAMDTKLIQASRINVTNDL